MILILGSTYGFSQDNYEMKLSTSLDRIREQNFFNNNVIMFSDSTEYAMAFPYWKSFDDYYEGDIVRFRNCQYAAKRDTKGKMPNASFHDWVLIRGPHPFLFLRDTAKVEDLKMLLDSDSPYIRTYSFVALSYRAHDGLFQVVVDKLSDTSTINEISSDFESEVYPAEIMMLYGVRLFTKQEKNQIRRLITSDYPHLKRCLKEPYW